MSTPLETIMATQTAGTTEMARTIETEMAQMTETTGTIGTTETAQTAGTTEVAETTQTTGTAEATKMAETAETTKATQPTETTTETQAVPPTAADTQPIAPRPALCSFGVELEILVAVLEQDTPDPAPASETRPVLHVPRGTSRQQATGYAQRSVAALLASCGLPVWCAPGSKDFEKTTKLQRCIADAMTNGKGRGGGAAVEKAEKAKAHYWVVDEDCSLHTDEFQLPTFWAGIEIQSPAMWEGKKALDQVRNVVEVLKKGLRSRVNHSCGLHVHVGAGLKSAQFSPDTLRRLAATVWAAEPLLSTLHPEYRRSNTYCHALRAPGRNAIVNGDNDQAVWKRVVKNDPEDAMRMLMHGRNRGVGAPPITKAQDEHKLARLLGGELDEASAAALRKELFGDMGQDILGVRGRPYARPHAQVPLSWPAKGNQTSRNADLLNEEGFSCAGPARPRLKGEPDAGFSVHDFHPDSNPVVGSNNKPRKKKSEKKKASKEKDGKKATEQPEDQQQSQPDSQTLKPLKAKEVKRLPSLIPNPNILIPDPALHLPFQSIPMPYDYHMLERHRGVLLGRFRRPRPPMIWPRTEFFPPHPPLCRPPVFRLPSTPLSLAAIDTSSVWHGVQHILSADLCDDQLRASLLFQESKYANYNFARTGHSYAASGLPSTVEFREAAGSLDAKWVCTWISVVVGLANWAMRVSWREFMQVMALLDAVQKPHDPAVATLIRSENIQYDVVSLIEDIGLPKVALRCMARLRRGEAAKSEANGAKPIGYSRRMYPRQILLDNNGNLDWPDLGK